MTFTALTPGAWLTLFGSVALVVTFFYLLRLRRRRVEVPFGPLWEKALNEKQSSSLFKVLKRIFSLLLQLLFVALFLHKCPRRYSLFSGHSEKNRAFPGGLSWSMPCRSPAPSILERKQNLHFAGSSTQKNLLMTLI